MTEIPGNVERGAEWLDHVHPGWERKIRLDTLDLSSSCDCVLGQLEGSWSGAVERRGWSYRDSSRLGFTPWGRQQPYRLTDAWTRLIERRRAA